MSERFIDIGVYGLHFGADHLEHVASPHMNTFHIVLEFFPYCSRKKEKVNRDILNLAYLKN